MRKLAFGDFFTLQSARMSFNVTQPTEPGAREFGFRLSGVLAHVASPCCWWPLLCSLPCSVAGCRSRLGDHGRQRSGPQTGPSNGWPATRGPRATGNRTTLAWWASARWPFCPSAGHSPGVGRYGQACERALNYVLKNAKPSGLLNIADPQRDMYNHGLATFVLGQAHGMTGDQRISPVLDRASSSSPTLSATTAVGTIGPSRRLRATISVWP